jgi:hypothetical protein
VPLVALVIKPHVHNQLLDKHYKSTNFQRQFGEPSVSLWYTRFYLETVDALDEQDFVDFTVHQPLSGQEAELRAGSVKEQVESWAVKVGDWVVEQVDGPAKQVEAQAAIQKADPLVKVDQHHLECS